MEPINYFKLQAKNLLKDYKTRFFNQEEGWYDYQPKNFDVTQIFLDFGINDDKEDFSFTLMNAQHIIAQLAGFRNWKDLANASLPEQELAHLLYDNAHKINIDEWYMYIKDAEAMNHTTFNAETKIEILKEVFLKKDLHRSWTIPYRLDLEKKRFTRPADLKENDYPTTTQLYDELDEKAKLSAIKAHQNSGYNFELDDTVECLHCGEKFLFKDVKAIRPKDQFRTVKDFDEIVCKNYPKCNGSIIDLIKQKGKK